MTLSKKQIDQNLYHSQICQMASMGRFDSAHALYNRSFGKYELILISSDHADHEVHTHIHTQRGAERRFSTFESLRLQADDWGFTDITVVW